MTEEEFWKGAGAVMHVPPPVASAEEARHAQRLDECAKAYRAAQSLPGVLDSDRVKALEAEVAAARDSLAAEVERWLVERNAMHKRIAELEGYVREVKCSVSCKRPAAVPLLRALAGLKDGDWIGDPALRKRMQALQRGEPFPDPRPSLWHRLLGLT